MLLVSPWLNGCRCSGKGEFFFDVPLTPGVYEYKFVVDDNWKIDSTQRTLQNRFGSLNNVLELLPDTREAVSPTPAKQGVTTHSSVTRPIAVRMQSVDDKTCVSLDDEEGVDFASMRKFC
jgi:hypothetical protein